MKKFSLQNGKKRFAIIGLLIFFGFGTVFLRLIWLQVIQTKSWPDVLPIRLPAR